MEINDLTTSDKHEAGAEYNVLDNKGKKTDVFITLQGADSKEWRKQKRKQTAAIMKARADETDIDYDELDVNALVEATISWRGLIKDKKEFPCTAENKKYLYENTPSLVNQLLVFIGDSANFTKG